MRKQRKKQRKVSQPTPSSKIEPLVVGFEGGALRSNGANRIDPLGYISPKAMQVYYEYMLKNQQLPDGRRRRSDNWKAGMPVPRYASSLMRHTHDFHTHWDELKHGSAPDDFATLQLVREALCGILFNTIGMLHEMEMGADILDEEGPGR